MHPADPNHRLTLFASSLIAKLPTECEACERYISGFYYSCDKCSVYYHMLCIAMPLSVKIPFFHPHILKLEIKPPYDFQCDLCDRPSYSGWLYRCRLCEFDAHISCAVTFNGTDPSLLERSVSEIYSVEDNRIRETKFHQNEVMELLSEGMKKGVEVKNEKNLDRDQFRSLDQSIMISEDFTLPSYHFSDACFSIDIAKSIERQSFDFREKYIKRELSLAPLTGIGSHVWEELSLENNNGHLNAVNERMQLKDQITEIENVRIFFINLGGC
ncbi:hypothetical protein DH2020_016751 [Rehmannia glutinosa]|uniref:Zinc finger PHD-type domain-containing protein n=1 Tax=Rehmannia glutinosa TaxID=99300 RepID=A0ABR0WPK7_REHGL